VLVALAASASVAAAIEIAVIAEAVVGAVDRLAGQSASDSARHDGVMEALVRVKTGSAERRHGVVRHRPGFSHHRQCGGERSDQSAGHRTSRSALQQRPNQVIKSSVIHRSDLQTRRGRSTRSARAG